MWKMTWLVVNHLQLHKMQCLWIVELSALCFTACTDKINVLTVGMDNTIAINILRDAQAMHRQCTGNAQMPYSDFFLRRAGDCTWPSLWFFYRAQVKMMQKPPSDKQELWLAEKMVQRLRKDHAPLYQRSNIPSHLPKNNWKQNQNKTKQKNKTTTPELMLSFLCKPGMYVSTCSKFSAPTIAFLAFWLAKKLRLWANSRSFKSYGK